MSLQLDWPLTGELEYQRCDDVQYRYIAAWAGGWMALVSVGQWHESRTVRLNYGHSIAGGRPLKVSSIVGASLEDNVPAALTATAGGHSVVETDGILQFRLLQQGQAYCSSRRGRRADWDRKTAVQKAAEERAAWEFHQNQRDTEPERHSIVVHDGSKVQGHAVGTMGEGGGARYDEVGHCFAFSVSYDIDFVNDRTVQYENLEEPTSPQVLCPGRRSPMPPSPQSPPSPLPPPTAPALVAMPPPPWSPSPPRLAKKTDDDLSREGDYLYDDGHATDAALEAAASKGAAEHDATGEAEGARLRDEVAAELAAEPIASLAVALMLLGLGGWVCWRKRGAAPCGRCVGYRRAGGARPRLGAAEEGARRRGRRGDGDDEGDQSSSGEEEEEDGGDEDEEEGGSPPRGKAVGKASRGRRQQQQGKGDGTTSTRTIDAADLD